MGWGGKGRGHWHHHHHHGVGAAVAEAALVGGAAVAGAAVATAVMAPRRPPPRREVIVVGASPVVAAPVASTPAPAVVVIEKGKGKGKWKGKGAAPVAVELPPLDVSAVGIPASAIEQRSGVTYFGIDVVPEKGASYRVQKRYNEFEVLKSQLGRMAPGARIEVDFPPKHFFSCEGAKLEDRRYGLERWLKRALNDPNSRGVWCLQLRGFLEVGQIHTLPAAAPYAAPAPYTAPPPYAPAPAPEVASAPAEEPEQVGTCPNREPPKIAFAFGFPLHQHPNWLVKGDTPRCCSW